MKTTAHQFTAFGNLAIVQVKSDPESNLDFKPAGPSIGNGGLVITESTGSGVVNQLLAVNHTEDYLLLTDADVLAGAKQNRIVNKSVLLRPLSKTALSVSCVERLRWHYTSGKFKSAGPVADPELRKDKADSYSRMKMRSDSFLDQTQGVVWDKLSRMFEDEGCHSSTESYQELIDHRTRNDRREFPVCEPCSGCNGLAVISGRKVVSVDIFGREEVYRYYFPFLRDSAFKGSREELSQPPVDMHEAFYRTLEAVDNFESATRIAENDYEGTGSLNIAENKDIIGFDLHFEGQLIHSVFFGK
jgi:hypothetical protein